MGMGRVGPGSRRARPGRARRHHRRAALAAPGRHGPRDGGRIGRARGRLGERAREAGSGERRRRLAGRRAGRGPRCAGQALEGELSFPARRLRAKATGRLESGGVLASSVELDDLALAAVAPRARLGRGRPRRGPRVEPRGAVDPARPAGERTRRRPSHARRPAAPRRAVGEPGADRAALGGAAIRRGALPAGRPGRQPERHRRSRRPGEARALPRARQCAAARRPGRARPGSGAGGGAPRRRQPRADSARRAVARTRGRGLGPCAATARSRSPAASMPSWRGSGRRSESPGSAGAPRSPSMRAAAATRSRPREPCARHRFSSAARR